MNADLRDWPSATVDLLAGCDCPTCTWRGRPVQVVRSRLRLSDGRVREVVFYGEAGGRVGAVEPTVSVPPRHAGTLGLEIGAWRWP